MTDAIVERLALIEARLTLLERAMARSAAAEPEAHWYEPDAALPEDLPPPVAEPVEALARDENAVSISELSQLDGEDFVSAAYLRILHKAVDPDGLDYHLYELGRGQDKGMLLRRMANEEEAIASGVVLID
jgi:hypothetical protein